MSVLLVTSRDVGRGITANANAWKEMRRVINAWEATAGGSRWGTVAESILLQCSACHPITRLRCDRVHTGWKRASRCMPVSDRSASRINLIRRRSAVFGLISGADRGDSIANEAILRKSCLPLFLSLSLSLFLFLSLLTLSYL